MVRLMHDGRSGLWAVACLALWTGGAASASAQDAPRTGGAPSLEALVRCADMGDKDTRLACYDSAMRAAGYAPKPEVVEAEHRKKFGLSMPKLGGSKRAKADKSQAPIQAEDANSTDVTVAQIAVTQPLGRLVIFTTDDQIWEQVDQELIPDRPAAGDKIHIHKEQLGGYFCDVSKYKTFRCKRDR
jgi:hypothetical protein